MLACFVCVIPRRGAFAVEIVEPAGAAEDIPSLTGFALLVDEPAAASDAADAFTGELISETASAAATADAGLFYAVLIDEPAGAFDAWSGTTGIVDGSVSEPATADTAQDAIKISAMVARSAMLPGVFVNSDGTPRQANADGVMVNL